MKQTLEKYTKIKQKGYIKIMKDESHLPTSEQSLVFRLRKRAEIRRQISTRKSVQEGAPDRIADLLDEAADEIEVLQKRNSDLGWALNPDRMGN
jgi:hypothetical protein